MATMPSIGSGANSIESLVQQYMAYERRPVQTLERKKGALNTSLAVYNDYKSKLLTLQNAAAKLADTTSASIFNSVSVSSSDTDVLRVNAGSNAAEGRYEFRIRQLATATTMKSTAYLNTKASTLSSAQVTAGLEGLDITDSWADAGFDTAPDGTITINGAVFSLADYAAVEDFVDAVNDDTAVTSWAEAVSGEGTIDTSLAWADAGFDTTPDGTVTINGETFTLADYATVDAFISAVNSSETANAALSYDSASDTFSLSSSDGTALEISETGTSGFFTAVNMTGPARANMYYDSDRDKFFIESGDSSDLVLSETGTLGFLSAVNIAAGTYAANASGLDSSAYLKDINFDSGFSAGESGSFKINGTDIAWDADTDTLNAVISRINRSSAGVTAFYDDTLDKVVFTAAEAGSEDIQWEDVEGGFLGDALKLTGLTQNTGLDAKFTINSTDASDEITKSSNEFTINGLNITLKAATVENGSYTDNGTTSVSVNSEKDESGLRSTVNSFLTAYNSMVDYIKAKTAVDTSTYTRGALAGDTLAVGLQSQIMGIILNQVEGVEDGKPKYLSEIGITLDSNQHASITDAGVFSDWINEDPQALADMFNLESTGIASRMEDLLQEYTKSYGLVSNKQDAISDNISNIDKRIATMEKRLEKKEEYYRKQFSSMQEMLTRITNQQAMLSSMMQSMQTNFGF